MVKKWTEEEIDVLVQKYLNGAETSELAEEYNCSMYQIRTPLKKRGITLRRHSSKRVYKSKAIVSLDTWTSKIGTPEFDYFIGLLASDGCIVNTAVCLELKDLELLEQYNDFLGGVCNINSRTSKVNGNIYYNIKYKNKEIVNFLSEYGIVPKKSSILQLPYINWNILLGIFDGDGCITHDKRGTYSFKFTITSGSINFINQVAQFLSGYFIKFGIQEYKTDSGHWYNLIVSNGQDIYTIYTNLYKESPYFLTRKKEKFCPLLEKFNSCNSVNSVKEMDNYETEPSLINKEGAETRNGIPK